MLTAELFTPISSNQTDLFREIQCPVLVNKFTTTNCQVGLMLTENYIVLFDNVYTQAPSHYCKLTFSVKSEVLFHTVNNLGVHFQQTQEQLQADLKQPLGIKFERQQCEDKVTFFSQYTNVLDAWMRELQKKINQRNFHKLFKAKKKIGKGAFATVYLAQRLRDRTMFAVKAFSKQKQYSSEKGRESLQNQISLMRNINHKNVMRLQGVYQTQNSIYLILQYLEGVQLNEVLKSNKVLSSGQQCDIIRNLLSGLQYLATSRIIHRDLKPENIMFRRADYTDAVICDFGLATFSHADKYLFVRCGTPGFVSPQVINIRDMSTKSDPISDVFSAGLIFHYLLFGHSIFPGKKYNEILNQNRACEFDFNQPKYQLINAQAFDLLRKMLEKDPTKRISAKKTLSHPYFGSTINKMQVDEPEKRIPFREITHNAYMTGVKQLQNQQSPSIIISNRPSFNYSGNNQVYRQTQNRRLY